MLDESKITVQRNNGESNYGEAVRLDDEIVPAAVREAVACEIIDRDEDDGIVSVGGQAWSWRRGAAAPTDGDIADALIDRASRLGTTILGALDDDSHPSADSD